jgi:hypothetical protein
MELSQLEPLVGTWATEAQIPGGSDDVARGETTFAWLEGGGYLVQHMTMDDPVFPRALTVIGPAEGGGPIVQHYFDSRGVARVYAIAVDEHELRLSRDDPDFAQRYTGRFEDGGSTITGAWERCEDGATWVHDFDLTYRRVR